MATANELLSGESIQNAALPAKRSLTAHPTSSLAFDGVMVALALWFMGGVFLDGSAHAHHAVDSFFTPWHAILYSGFMVNAIAIFGVTLRNINKGYSRWLAIPAGYELSFVGALIFGVAGVLDLIWHTVLGIEVSFEALLSPPHLLLALGMFLIVGGPFRAAWRRTTLNAGTALAKNLAWLPMLLSLTFMLCSLTFFTFPAHPFIYVWVNAANRSVGDRSVTLALPAILLQAGILMGCLLLAIRRWKLPFGSVTLVLALNTAALSVISSNWQFMPIAIISGLLADAAITLFDPSPKKLTALRAFAFGLPTVLYLLYFAQIAVTGGLAWRVPLWGGAAVLAGVAGLLLSYLMVPSPASLIIPADR